MWDGSDLDAYGFTDDDLRARLRGDQLLYLPYLERAETPYGFSLVEQALIPIMTGLRKQAYQLVVLRREDGSGRLHLPWRHHDDAEPDQRATRRS